MDTIFSAFSFHDTSLLKVVEDKENDTLDFLLSFPVDWENQLYEKRTLRFSGIFTHIINETPFHGTPTILTIEEIRNDKFINTSGLIIDLSFAEIKVCIETNAGNRLIASSGVFFFQ